MRSASPGPTAGGSRGRGTRPDRVAAVALALACWLLPPAAPAHGQAADTLADAAENLPDVEDVLDDARDRQRAFERHRRRRLPYASGRSGGRCDEFVGRYCLWHEEGDEDYERPEEDDSVVRARARLLDHLAHALETVPGSDWLTGQRVRYLLEDGQREDALRAATDGCGAARWWCRALEGLVLHEREDFAGAGRAFDAALAAMAPERRRRWSDLAVLLEGDAADRWEEAEGRERERLARRLWRLADPLWLVPGNDRRTEHLARRTQVRMREDAATPFGPHWNDALGELTLRYGVPFAFGREPPGPGTVASRPSVVGRHHPDALHWLPSSDALLDPAGLGPDGWQLEDPEPRAEHAPPYADTTARLEHWLSVFPRGDSTVVVAAFAAAPDTADRPPDRPRDGPRDEALLGLVPAAALDSSAADPPRAEDRGSGGPRRGLAVRVPSRPHVLSLERLRRDARRAERARYGLPLRRRPEALPGLSDLLVLQPADSLPAGLEAALPRARPPRPAEPGDRLALYWELYGPRRLLGGVEVSLRLAEAEGGVVDRLAGALGLRDGQVVALGWRGRVGEAGRVHPRGVQLRLPAELAEGDYRLVLSVLVPGHEEMRAMRRLRVETPD